MPARDPLPYIGRCVPCHILGISTIGGMLGTCMKLVSICCTRARDIRLDSDIVPTSVCSIPAGRVGARRGLAGQRAAGFKSPRALSSCCCLV